MLAAPLELAELFDRVEGVVAIGIGDAIEAAAGPAVTDDVE